MMGGLSNQLDLDRAIRDFNRAVKLDPLNALTKAG
jgi:hypothetical protein